MPKYESDDDFDEEESMDISPPKGKVKAKLQEDASKKYVKKTPLEHVLLRPDTYIGSVESKTEEIYVFDKGTGMNRRQVSFVPGLYKIFDEILVNAADHKQRDSNMNTVKVEINVEENRISVYNNGEGIPIQMHSEEKVWIPEMIFGHLLTSSNYDDNEKKVTGGRNGYGAKLANIFSTQFVLETADTQSKQKFSQSWTNNMKSAGKPSITKYSLKNGYTKVTFYPDLKLFGMDKLDDDIVALMTKRVYDVAGCNPTVKVYFNDELIPIRNFMSYCKLYLKDDDKKFVFEQVNDRWQVCVTLSDGQPEQVSFVNSICTIRGGTHVNHITDKISKSVIELIKKKKNGPTVKPHQVKHHLWVFVNSLIENPAFDSQTKETLTSKVSSFGSNCNFSEDFFKKIAKIGLVENVISWATFKETNALKKTGGKKKEKITGIKKLSDANDAGSKHAGECTLILTEGDSAKTLAISGLSVIGRDKYGVFPLKGKVLNVREAPNKQIMDNEELNNLKKILGLQHGKVYTRETLKKELRYGKLMIMTDQDHDGSHIKGLLINFIHHFWPSILKSNIFLQEFVTPIIKASKGKQVLSFFTIPEYNNWKRETGGAHGWKIRYYKGLGTSTAAEAKEYFKNLRDHKIEFQYKSDKDDSSIEMAFSKKKADQRKDWIRALNKEETFVDHRNKKLCYEDFIHKELVLFSSADCERSIPSMVDGMKPGQRKILFSCFKRKLKSEIKVAQLAGYVSEQSAYHHGEASLMSTIINMCQNYVGSNNINLLYPAGQFGSRLMGGKDAASPRYIFTRLCDITRKIFPEEDDHLLEYLDDDGQSIEPKWYMPILPMVLVNGADGIGTGWSTDVSNYSPREITENILRLLSGKELETMHPWYRGFNGEIEIDLKNKNYSVKGVYEKLSANSIRVTELPIGTWTQSFKEHLESLLSPEGGKAQVITDFRDNSSDTIIDFVVKFPEGVLEEMESNGTLEKKLKLVSSKFSQSNMHLFTADGIIKKYETAEDILTEFYHLRLTYYQKRKDFLLKIKKEETDRVSNRVRFILMVISGEIVIANRKKDEILAVLKKKNFDELPPKTRKPRAKSAIETEEEEEDSKASYDYLLSMPLWSLTLEKVNSLKEEKEKLQGELEALLATTKEDLWRNDLMEFLKELDIFENDVGGKKGVRKVKVKTEESSPQKRPRGKPKAATNTSDITIAFNKTKPKEEQPSPRAKKAKVDSEDDYEEDSPKPARKKAAAKPKEPKEEKPKTASPKKNTAKAVNAKSIDQFFSTGKRKTPDSPEPTAKSTTKKQKMLTLDSDSDDDDMDLLQKIKAKNNIQTETKKEAPKTKAPAKAATKAAPAKAPAKAATKAATKPRVKKEIDSDEDVEEEEEEVAAKKPKTKTVDSYFKTEKKPELKVLPSRNKLKKSAFHDSDDDFEDEDDDDFDESFD